LQENFPKQSLIHGLQNTALFRRYKGPNFELEIRIRTIRSKNSYYVSNKTIIFKYTFQKEDRFEKLNSHTFEEKYQTSSAS
jgi:hypothetical protein